MNNHDTTIALKRSLICKAISRAHSRHFFVVRESMFSTSLLPTFFMRFSWCQTAKSTRGKFVVAFINLLCISLNNSCHNKIIKFQLLTSFILQPPSWIVWSSQKSSVGVNCWMSIWQVSFNTFSVKMHSTKQCKIKVRLLLCWRTHNL